MADWFVSSAAYASVAVFATSHAYSIGDIVRPLTAPATGHEYAFRCTTAGTSSTEPTWPAGNNATITSGGATFTNVSGQSKYGSIAPAGTLYSISQVQGARTVVSDRIFISSDHSETSNPNQLYFAPSAGFGLVQVISVNRAGSVPPVAADVTTGAAFTCSTGSLILEAMVNMYYEGITFTYAGTTFQFNNSTDKTHWFKNCAFVFTSSSSSFKIDNAAAAKVVWDHTTIQFGNAGQQIRPSFPFELIWLNTPSAIQGATIPTTLFGSAGSGSMQATCRGVDISALTGTLMANNSSTGHLKLLLDSCRIASGLTRYATPTSNQVANDEIELVNSYDGTNVINERYTAAGTVTTDRSTYLSGGTQDDIGNYSLKLVSSTRSDFATLTLDSFWLDVENTVIGASKTATVEIISSGSLNNNDIRLLLEYMGTSGNPIASFVDSFMTLTTTAALASSSNTWNSPPSTPQKQLLQVTFTPQVAGRVRGLVRLGKVSTTVWVNPQVTIT